MAMTDAELRARCVAVAHQTMEVEEHRGTPAEPSAWRKHGRGGWLAIYEMDAEAEYLYEQHGRNEEIRGAIGR